ncbi:unnamed protein product [Blepharisma stoltei]|uniref:PH domain-containing protein n=1 Tax=Blepharisma stoltei TaxID=1481888 RepID=A0AAU9IMG0_9CILI|nr:unnamed protein product [Blepharisma stoltei]
MRPDLQDFVKEGSQVVKLSLESDSQSRFFWVSSETKEIRWSKSAKARNFYQKIEIDRLFGVRRFDQSKAGNSEYGFILETKNKEIKFTVESYEIREKWIEALTEIIVNKTNISSSTPIAADENDGSPWLMKRRTVPPSVLGDYNYEMPVTGSRELFAKTNQTKHHKEILEEVRELLQQQTGKQISIEDLPIVLDEIIQNNQTKIWESKQEILRQNEENDPKKLQNKVSSLRKRIKMLEVEQEQIDAQANSIEELNRDIAREKKQKEELTNKIHEITQEKNKYVKEGSIYKADLDAAIEKNAVLEKELYRREKKDKEEDPRIDLLRKGFHGYLLTIANPELADDLNLTPRRPYEDGVYKKRLITLNQDCSQLIWKPISLFSNKKAVLKTSDITSALEGTEDPQRLEPFTNNRYLTILAPGLTLIISVEKSFGFYLEAIKDLYLQVNSIPISPCDIPAHDLYQLGNDQLQSQMVIYDRLIKRYKTSLTESICYVDKGSASQQEMLLNELQTLKILNEDMIQGVLTSDIENYFRHEKAVLLERCSVLEKILAQAKEEKDAIEKASVLSIK